ncbi:MAG TPA: hypothetical protein VK756_09770 [Solirubrobacteraceae bacterium]|jgi:hypothetical protein|nr:hypothetical protein [Solirubrobacteraceae bacterium]
MSFAGIILACWLGIAGIAFLALSGLGRLAARGDVEANLGIVGDAELRMLVGGREQPRPSQRRPSLETRLAQLGVSGAPAAWGVSGVQAAWASREDCGRGTARHASAGYTT